MAIGMGHSNNPHLIIITHIKSIGISQEAESLKSLIIMTDNHSTRYLE